MSHVWKEEERCQTQAGQSGDCFIIPEWANLLMKKTKKTKQKKKKMQFPFPSKQHDMVIEHTANSGLEKWNYSKELMLVLKQNAFYY